MSRNVPAPVAGAVALLLLCTAAFAETRPTVVRLDPDPGWRSASSIASLVAVLENWLDTRSDYPRRELPPRIVLSDLAATAGLGGATRAPHETRRGVYDPDTATVYLMQPWSAKRAEDVSVLLHELVHYRQDTARHWYCPGAQEPDAYKLQRQWLAERGLEIEVNWIAIALEAGCTPRDIHPE